MFGFITDSVENALDVVDRLVSGEDVSKRQLAKLLSDGIAVGGGIMLAGAVTDALKDSLDTNEQE